MTLPTVVIGLGRTYASAARKPGVDPISAGVLDCFDDIDGVLSEFLSFSGMIGD